MWYFPKGVPHSLQGVDEENEFLLCFDDGDFEAVGTSFNIVDWLLRTPPDVLGKNFGVNASVFQDLPQKPPYIQKGTVGNSTLQQLQNSSDYLWRAKDRWITNDAGSWVIVDKEKFPIITSLASTVVKLKPGRIRELHWNTNVGLIPPPHETDT